LHKEKCDLTTTCGPRLMRNSVCYCRAFELQTNRYKYIHCDGEVHEPETRLVVGAQQSATQHLQNGVELRTQVVN
jgi:hypothetical protein